MNTISLADKYRPTSVEELVLPAQHQLQPALQFVGHPYSASWLFTGKSGIGKTSLARIIASRASDFHHIYTYVGADLDSNRVQDIANILRYRPMMGQFHSFVVNEADCIPRVGQIRLLNLLEDIKHAVWLFSSNEDTSSFEERFLSRVKCVNFTTQGLTANAIPWLIGIALKEGLDLSEFDAEKIIRASKNNLRLALQALELRLACVPA